MTIKDIELKIKNSKNKKEKEYWKEQLRMVVLSIW